MTAAPPSFNHHLRVPLAAEIHSRPFLKLEAPEALSHFAVYLDRDGKANANAQSQHALLAELCMQFGVAAPAPGANHFYHDFGRFRLKWECHTEFATFTFAEHVGEDRAEAEAFAEMPLRHLPQQWMAGLHGKLMVAAHVVLERGAAEPEAVQRAFQGNLVGASVMEGGQLWTDFAIQSDGFSRFVLRDVDMHAQQAGRLVQRVLEIETYRMMALLGLPSARIVSSALNEIEAELAALATAMVATDAAGVDEHAMEGGAEQALLDQITRLAARLEKLSLDTSYRFSASKAYFRLVDARIEELRESRIGGVPTVEEFMDRRLAPAMHTCAATADRMDVLGQRIANTNDLLRTRVGIVQEMQNRQILQSMNARAAQQLRLQQAVEGLSVAAISYYVIGLLSYSVKAGKLLGLVGNPEVVIGVLVPVVAGCVWFALRRMHAQIHT